MKLSKNNQKTEENEGKKKKEQMGQINNSKIINLNVTINNNHMRIV